MKRAWGCLLTVWLLLGACSNSGEQTTAATPSEQAQQEVDDVSSGDLATAQAATPSAQPAADPTATPVTFSEGDRLSAAIAALDESPDPNLFAYDVLVSVVDDNVVRLTLCTWTGETVFDQVMAAEVEVSDGTPSGLIGQLRSFARTSGDCLNETLIQSAFDFINEYERRQADAFANPASFATDTEFRSMMTEERAAELESKFSDYVADGVYVTSAMDKRHNTPKNLLAPAMGRRYRSEDTGSLELALCREMRPDYGIYAGEVLVTDERQEDSAGSHSITAIVLEREDDSWIIDGVTSRIWGDCFRTGDWPGAVRDWRPDPAEWQVLER